MRRIGFGGVAYDPPLRIFDPYRSSGRHQCRDGEVFPVPAAWAKRAHVTATAYEAATQRVEADPNGYWSDIGRRLDWSKPFTQVKDVSFDATDFHIRWFADGELNVSVNCLDRHLENRGDQIAIIWERDDPEVYDALSFLDLHTEVCRWANILKARGVKKGDRVTIYLPMISGGRGRNARLRADRGDPFGGVRRLLTRQPGRTDSGLRVHGRHHRRRRGARRQDDSTEAQR